MELSLNQTCSSSTISNFLLLLNSTNVWHNGLQMQLSRLNDSGAVVPTLPEFHLHNGNYMLNYEVYHKRNNGEKRRAENDRERDKSGCSETEISHRWNELGTNIKTGFHVADVSGDYREHRELEIHKALTLANKNFFCKTKSPL